MCVTKRPFLDKKTKIHKFQLSFLLPIFFPFNNKKIQICWNPYFFCKPKKENFQKINLKHWEIGKPNFGTPFLKKGYF